MTDAHAPTRSEADVLHTNRRFYEALWSDARLITPERFNTWPLFGALAAEAQHRLEVAPGLRPRLPLADTCFVDMSHAALRGLCRQGARTAHAMIGALPFPDAHFDLVCALDILEHVVDDVGALAELARVATPDATLLLSVPLDPDAWTAFDDFVGHYRRYEPAQIATMLSAQGWRIERSAIYGMQPESSRLLDLGQWFLTHQRERAMWWYNRVFMPLGLRFQKPLAWRDGLGDTAGVDELLLVCHRDPTPAGS
jgi:SAM-dependent methyltransferase